MFLLYCRELFLQKKKGDHYSHSDSSWVGKDRTKVSISLNLHHYLKKGVSNSYSDMLRDTTAMLYQNKQKEWTWNYISLDRGYEISLSDGAKEYLASLLREAQTCMEDENTPDSEELYDFWSEYFPEDTLPPVFSFPGLGDLAPES